MRISKFFPSVLIIGTASMCFADTFATHLQWSVQVNADGNVDSTQQSDVNSKDGTGMLTPIDVAASLETKTSSANPNYTHDIDVTGGYSGNAMTGKIGAALTGFATTTYSGPFLSVPSGQMAGSISSSWNDTVELHSNLLTAGSPVTINSSLVLSGDIIGIATGQDPGGHHDGRYYASVGIKGLGILGDDGSGASFTKTFQGSFNPSLGAEVNMTIPVTIHSTAGQMDTWGEELDIAAQCYAGGDYSVPGTVTSGIGTNFQDTLKWGGISSVIDDSTGLPLTDYTLSSASGFDYTQPFSVPEPGSASLVAITTIAFLGRRVINRPRGK